MNRHFSPKKDVIFVVHSLSHAWQFATSWTTAYQAPLSSTMSWNLLKFMSIESVMLSKHIFYFCLQSFPASRDLPMSWLFSSDAKVLELQLQQQNLQWIYKVVFLQDWLVWSPCSLRGSQVSSPAPQFESINSLVLSILYGPTITFIPQRKGWQTLL